MKITKEKIRKLIKESLGYTPTAKHIFMLIGPPSIGKSTWIRENVPDAFIISSDETVEAAAKSAGFTYDDLFAGYPTEEQLNMPKLDQDGNPMIDKNTGKPILKGYVHPKYGPIADQQIGWKSFKPDAFQFTNAAEKKADDELERLKTIATQSGKPIVVDMTNTSAHIRKMVMDQINPGSEFIKVGVIFEFAGAEEDIKHLARTRNTLRQLQGKGPKTIPDGAYDRIMGGYQAPEEGEFDQVVIVDNRGKVKDFINYNLGRISSLIGGHG